VKEGKGCELEEEKKRVRGREILPIGGKNSKMGPELESRGKKPPQRLLRGEKKGGEIHKMEQRKKDKS